METLLPRRASRATPNRYYALFAAAYGWCGRRAHAVLANSSWTKNHVENVFGRNDVALAYPPCDTSALQAVAAGRTRPRIPAGQPGGPKVLVVSLAQF